LGPKAALGNMEKLKFLILTELELRPLGRPARSQSLYRLRYRGSTTLENHRKTRQQVEVAVSWFEWLLRFRRPNYTDRHSSSPSLVRL
jgi:hypothetical protein